MEMKFERDENSGELLLHFTEDSFVHFYQEWWQLSRGDLNWIDFTFINLSVEKDDIMPGYEINFNLLGLGVRIRINKDMNSTPQGQELKKSIKELDKLYPKHN